LDRYECDKAMRRSKERCYTAKSMVILRMEKWQCKKNCAECICGMHIDKDGIKSHVRLKGGKA